MRPDALRTAPPPGVPARAPSPRARLARARSSAASGWRRSAPSTTRPRRRAPRPTSCPRRRPRARPGPGRRQQVADASIVKDAGTVIAHVFDEADRRDPKHRRTWVALVDGNNHQIQRIKAEAKARSVKVTIIVDFIHVLEYLWTAAGCLFPNLNPAEWVHLQATGCSKDTPRRSPARSAAPPPAAWTQQAASSPTTPPTT